MDNQDKPWAKQCSRCDPELAKKGPHPIPTPWLWDRVVRSGNEEAIVKLYNMTKQEVKAKHAAAKRYQARQEEKHGSQGKPATTRRASRLRLKVRKPRAQKKALRRPAASSSAASRLRGGAASQSS